MCVAHGRAESLRSRRGSRPRTTAGSRARAALCAGAVGPRGVARGAAVERRRQPGQGRVRRGARRALAKRPDPAAPGLERCPRGWLERGRPQDRQYVADPGGGHRSRKPGARRRDTHAEGSRRGHAGVGCRAGDPPGTADGEAGGWGRGAAPVPRSRRRLSRAHRQVRLRSGPRHRPRRGGGPASATTRGQQAQHDRDPAPGNAVVGLRHHGPRGLRRRGARTDGPDPQRRRSESQAQEGGRAAHRRVGPQRRRPADRERGQGARARQGDAGAVAAQPADAALRRAQRPGGGGCRRCDGRALAGRRPRNPHRRGRGRAGACSRSVA